MSDKAERTAETLNDELYSLRYVDPHTHVAGNDPAAKNPADIIGYHYYTELAHSAGLPREQIEDPGIEPDEKFRRIFCALGPIRNTNQWGWFKDIWEVHFGYTGSFAPRDWRKVYDAAARKLASANWEQQVIETTGLDAVFMTNNFDDPLEGYDTDFYIPCFRTDDLVFHLDRREVRERLAHSTGISLSGPWESQSSDRKAT